MNSQAIDPREERKLLGIKARYLKQWAMALAVELVAEMEALGNDCPLDLDEGVNLRDEVRRFEIDLIKYALQRTGGHQLHAANFLGMNSTTLNSKLKRYGLDTRVFRRVESSDVLSGSTRIEANT